MPNTGCPDGPSLTWNRGSHSVSRETIISSRPSTVDDIVGGRLTLNRNGPPCAVGTLVVPVVAAISRASPRVVRCRMALPSVMSIDICLRQPQETCGVVVKDVALLAGRER